MAESAIRVSSRGVLLDVVVTPNAPRSEVRGIDPWRKALRIGVGAQAREGAANAELLRFLAESLRVSATAVRLVSGHTSRRKTVAVDGLSEEEVLARLRLGGE